MEAEEYEGHFLDGGHKCILIRQYTCISDKGLAFLVSRVGKGTGLVAMGDDMDDQAG